MASFQGSTAAVNVLQGVPMADVFVSYKAEDRKRVQPLVQALQSHGFDVWWDEHIGAGDEWRETIERQLDSARCVLVVWSKKSVGKEGRFVRDEASRAQRRGVYVPVLLDAVPPPLGFGETQAPSLTGWRGDRSDARFEALVQSIRRMVGSKPAQPSPATFGPMPSRRTVLVGAGAAAVMAAGAAGWQVLRRGEIKQGRSIAVLPFANLSGDPGQAYFADGIAEELRTALSRIGGLEVVARTSSEAVRNVDAKEASRKLSVENILTGSVRRSPAMIRVSAQLVDGGEGIEKWSETYDRPIGDALQIQTDIADKVAQALSVRLGAGKDHVVLPGGTSNPEAQDLLLKAKAYVRQRDGREAWEQGLALVDAALALDPSYAEAAATKADMLKVIAGGMSLDAAEAASLYQKASVIAQRAIQLSPQSRSGYSVLADILYQRLRPKAALDQYRKMLSLPGSAATLVGYSIFLGEDGRFDEALRIVDEIITADPLNPQVYTWKASILTAARRYREAIAVTQRQQALVPDRPGIRMRLGYLHMLMGDTAQAASLMQSVPIGEGVEIAYRAVLAARLGDVTTSERFLRQFAGHDYAYYQVAEVLAQLGRKDEAIAALENAWTNRDSGLTQIKVDPLLDPLRRDRRFQAIVDRIGFPTW